MYRIGCMLLHDLSVETAFDVAGYCSTEGIGGVAAR
jgi:hypothetical protein